MEPGRDQRNRPRISPFKSGPIPWTVTILLAVLVVAVIVAMVTLLVLTLVLQPHAPYVAVQAAKLNALRFDQLAFRDVQVSLLLEAHNNNGHSKATFSGLQYRLRFAGGTLAVLRADEPLSVPARTTVPLPYLASVRDAPLSDVGRAALQAAFRDGVVTFEVDGEVSTHYHFTRFVSISKLERLRCQLQFFLRNGSALDFDCTPKEPPFF